MVTISEIYSVGLLHNLILIKKKLISKHSIKVQHAPLIHSCICSKAVL